MNEDIVIQEVLQGRTGAFAQIVRAYQGRVLGLCLSLLRNPAEAEDAAQDIFVKVFEHLPRFRSDSSFSTWLYSIAQFHCLDILKAKQRRRTDSLEALVEARGDGILPIEKNPGSEALDAHTIEQVLSGLRPDERIILTMREVQGLTYEELAEALRISLDAVKSRLRRAREALQVRARHILGAPRVKMAEAEHEP